MRYTTYLFDFDYTLADSSKGIVTCFQNVLHDYGYTDISDDNVKRTIGKTLDDSFALLTQVSNPIQIEEFKKAYGRQANEHMTVNTRFFPETVEVLNQLKSQGVKLGIISTKYRFRILDFLKNTFPAEFFDIIIVGEDVSTHKPSHEGILKAIDHLGVSAKDVLYIGDSTVDAETAQAASIDFVGVLNGMTTKEELHEYPHVAIIPSLIGLIYNLNNEKK